MLLRNVPSHVTQLTILIQRNNRLHSSTTVSSLFYRSIQQLGNSHGQAMTTDTAIQNLTGEYSIPVSEFRGICVNLNFPCQSKTTSVRSSKSTALNPFNTCRDLQSYPSSRLSIHTFPPSLVNDDNCDAKLHVVSDVYIYVLQLVMKCKKCFESNESFKSLSPILSKIFSIALTLTPPVSNADSKKFQLYQTNCLNVSSLDTLLHFL